MRISARKKNGIKKKEKKQYTCVPNYLIFFSFVFFIFHVFGTIFVLLVLFWFCAHTSLVRFGSSSSCQVSWTEQIMPCRSRCRHRPQTFGYHVVRAIEMNDRICWNHPKKMCEECRNRLVRSAQSNRLDCAKRRNEKWININAKIICSHSYWNKDGETICMIFISVDVHTWIMWCPAKCKGNLKWWLQLMKNQHIYTKRVESIVVQLFIIITLLFFSFNYFRSSASHFEQLELECESMVAEEILYIILHCVCKASVLTCLAVDCDSERYNIHRSK